MVNPFIRTALPYLNFTIATSALVFQTTVLYPWHEELDEAFQKLRADHVSKLEEFHQIKVQRLEALEQRLHMLDPKFIPGSDLPDLPKPASRVN
ncbi:hypothetical protein [Phaffia rhodozyma]|uniref:Uncharacterized protein n=1 Tax=Phaffia rhodozyma TaxID=264483 RepID=A0A0F7SNU0_PHARH|nr:hypothetical protein [Phaffia rhodozyma]